MRKLKTDEIECRVSQVTANGCQLLLYKTARVDRAILDEEFGAMNWQNDFKLIDGKMYGGIGVYNNGQWIWRWDCGTESNTEAEKGQASDCFKRAGFKWGIGVELYTAPFIFINCDTVKDGQKYKLADKYQKFKVSDIGYADNGDINKLKIVNDKKVIVYEMGKFIKPKEKDDAIKEHIKNLKMCQSRSDIDLYWASLDKETKKNEEFLKVLKEVCEKYPKVELVRDENSGKIKEVQS